MKENTPPKFETTPLTTEKRNRTGFSKVIPVFFRTIENAEIQIS